MTREEIRTERSWTPAELGLGMKPYAEDPPDSWRTTDICIAATLLYYGVEMLGFGRRGGRQLVFYFANPVKDGVYAGEGTAPALLHMDWLNGKCRVEPKFFHSAIKHLKAMADGPRGGKLNEKAKGRKESKG